MPYKLFFSIILEEIASITFKNSVDKVTKAFFYSQKTVNKENRLTLFLNGNFLMVFLNTQNLHICNLTFRLRCYHHTAFWCDYITWISSTISKWNRLYLEYSTVNWTIDSIQFFTFPCRVTLKLQVSFYAFHCKMSKNKNLHFQLL